MFLETESLIMKTTWLVQTYSDSLYGWFGHLLVGWVDVPLLENARITKYPIRSDRSEPILHNEIGFQNQNQ